MSGKNSPSAERHRDKWRAFKRAEAAMWHASMIYRGTGDHKAAVEAAQEVRAFFDRAYEEARPIADANTTVMAQKAMSKKAIR